MTTHEDVKEPTVWVVIVNYHSQELICKCISSLKVNVNHSFKVVVVDNSQPHCTDKIIEKHNDTIVITAEKNGGFAAGCNLGIKYSMDQDAKYVLLLNPDTYAEQDFIHKLVTAFNNDSSLGIAGPTIYFSEPRDKLWMAGTKVNWWTGGPKHIYDDHILKRNRITPVPFISGCAMMLRASAIQDVGLMDEKYFLYFEDADYCQTFLSKGWEIFYVPQAEVIHDVSSTTGYQSENYVYYFSRNRIWFLYCWAPFYKFVYYLVYTIAIKLPGSVVIFTLLQCKPKLTIAFIKGFFHGIAYMKMKK